jgi:hypothetical protein
MEQEQIHLPPGQHAGGGAQPVLQSAFSCSDGTSSDTGTSNSSGTDSASSSRNTPRARQQQQQQQQRGAASSVANPSASPRRLSSQQQPGSLAELHALEATLRPDSNSHSSSSTKDLADVSHRLKKLERAVKAHLLAGQRGLSCGGASILASASGAQQQHSMLGGDAAASFGSPVFAPSSADGTPAAAASGPRLSERVQLRETLSGIKTDIADLAVRQVEAQMLQQRVLRLEAVIAGMGGLGALTGVAGPAGMSMAGGLSRFAGSLAGAGGVLGGAPAARPEPAPRLTRAPSGELQRAHLVLPLLVHASGDSSCLCHCYIVRNSIPASSVLLCLRCCAAIHAWS